MLFVLHLLHNARTRRVDRVDRVKTRSWGRVDGWRWVVRWGSRHECAGAEKVKDAWLRGGFKSSRTQKLFDEGRLGKHSKGELSGPSFEPGRGVLLGWSLVAVGSVSGQNQSISFCGLSKNAWPGRVKTGREEELRLASDPRPLGSPWPPLPP